MTDPTPLLVAILVIQITIALLLAVVCSLLNLLLQRKQGKPEPKIDPADWWRDN